MARNAGTAGTETRIVMRSATFERAVKPGWSTRSGVKLDA
jgi:hypothetical protein